MAITRTESGNFTRVFDYNGTVFTGGTTMTSLDVSGTINTNNVQTDIVTEKTPNAGVTIETVLVKDGAVTTPGLVSVGGVLRASTIQENVNNAGVEIELALLRDGGITLSNAVAGYVPTPLNFYERYDVGGTVSGIWAAPIGVFPIIIRTGTSVVFFITSAIANATTSAQITLDTPIPARFRPPTSFLHQIVVYDDSATPTQGAVIIQADGVVVIGLGLTTSNFTGTATTSTSGYETWSVSYIVN